MSVALTNCITAGYVDLATYDELETYMYGGSDALANFVRATRKSNWFTQVPCQLQTLTGTPGFGQNWSAKITRGGDYMLHNWLRLKLGDVTPRYGAGALNATSYLRWTHNFMHNITELCTITFNDIVESKFDSYFLDFWAAFTVPAGKQVGYGNMIGNVDSLVNPITAGAQLPQTVLSGRVLNLPLPLPHTRDSGLALPTAALPYNEMAINFRFRDWKDLLIVTDTNTGLSRTVTDSDVTSAPTMTECAVWANYVVVSNDERKKMGKAPRDMIIEQAQLLVGDRSSGGNWAPNTNSQLYVDIKYSQAVKVMFFAIRNTTLAAEHSNYTTKSPTWTAGAGVVFPPADGFDPIARAGLSYENTQRLPMIPVDYYSLINPWYHAINIPPVTGYHCYSYSLWFADLTPRGSTNYSKLNSVTRVFDASDDAITQAGAGQKYTVVDNCIDHNVIRISGGALGFPVL